MPIDIFRWARSCCVCSNESEVLLQAVFEHRCFPFVFHTFRYYHEECIKKFLKEPAIRTSRYGSGYSDKVAAKAITVIPSYEEILIARAERKLMCENSTRFIANLNSSTTQENINHAKSRKTKYKKLDKNDEEIKSKFDSIFNEKETSEQEKK